MRRMTVRVAVVDRVPMYARGLAATIEDHGGVAEVPADLLAWARRPGAVLVFLALADDADWQTLAALVGVRPDAVVVAVVAALDADVVVRAVTAGARGFLSRDDGAATVGAVLRAALHGQSLISAEVLGALVSRSVSEPARRLLSDDEIGWLRRLADGITVAHLAAQAGYSERMMFRLLAGVYARLGVDSRTKALIRARDEGWL
jgi:DNA-binding NarL/FixJ family response regulator